MVIHYNIITKKNGVHLDTGDPLCLNSSSGILSSKILLAYIL